MPDQPVHDVRNQLIKLFADAAASIAARLDAKGLPTTVEQLRSFVTRDDAGGARTDQVDERQSSLSDFELLMRASPLLDEPVIESLRRTAEAVASKHAATLPCGFYPGGGTWPLTEPLFADRNQPPDFARDPADWTSRVLLQPALLHYLKCVPDVHDVDIPTAELFAADVERVASADDLSYVVCLPLSAINLEPADGPVVCGEYELRVLSATEQADWFSGLSDNGLWQVGGFVAFPSVLATIRAAGPRGEPMHPRRDVADLFVIACYLYGHRIAGSVVATMTDPVWVQGGKHSGPLSVPRSSRQPATIGADALRDVVATIPILARFNMRQPRSPKDLALHRFAAGIARQNDADAVLDFVIALEALLLPYDPDARHGDLSYRFRIHGAMFIAEATDQRREVVRQLRDLYEMRSRLVHGGKYPNSAEITDARSTACELAARGLRRAVHDGFPDAGKFNAMVLDS
jgi:hypothetical protein